MSEQKTPDFLSELRRRGVLRAAVLYVGGAWAAIEAADTTFPRLGLPDVGVTVLVWAAVILFPVSVAVVWLYDLEGGRLRRDRSAPRRSTLALLAGMAALTAGLGLAAWSVWLRPGPIPSESLDEARVAVLPFRTAGAGPELGYLREGLVDLLAAKLTGEVGPRAVDPRTVMSAWRRVAGTFDAELPRDSALAVARTAGAPRAIIGSVVGSASSVTINASLVHTGGGDAPTTGSVVGPVDSLPALVDRLAGILLSLASGQDARELDALSAAPLPALRSFLLGEAAYRRGEYEMALERFRAALDTDSTFALAAFGIERAAPWTSRPEERERGRRFAWRYRDRLSTLDRVHLTGRAGPAYPAHAEARELLEVREQAVELMPDRAEVWYELGDLFFHWGRVLGEEDPFGRAIEGFQRALELDPDFAAPIHHSILIATMNGDADEVRRLRSRLEGGSATFGRWLEAILMEDSAWLDDFGARLDTLPPEVLIWVVGATEDLGLPVATAERATDVLTTLPGTPAEKRAWLLDLRTLALNAGHPGAAARALDAYAGLAPDPDHARRLAVLDALYSGGDSARADAAAKGLEASSAQDGKTGLENRCVAAQWRLRLGGRLDDPGLPQRARTAAGDGRGAQDGGLRACAEIVEALASPPGPRRDAVLDRLESFLLRGPFTGLTDFGDPYYANLALARLREQSGDLAGALAAVRRRTFFHGDQPYSAEAFRAEARLQERLGRRDEAIAAYRRYLNLRGRPEPARAPEVASARASLAALEGAETGETGRAEAAEAAGGGGRPGSD